MLPENFLVVCLNFKPRLLAWIKLKKARNRLRAKHINLVAGNESKTTTELWKQQTTVGSPLESKFVLPV